MEWGWFKSIDTEIEDEFSIEIDSSDSNDIHNDAVAAVYEMYGIDAPLFVEENGFYSGDATDDELETLRAKLHASDDDELFQKLNDSLYTQYEAHARKFAQGESLAQDMRSDERAMSDSYFA